ncbi:hypothetical protein H4P12_08355 [Paracoccus sp. 11-3]|uniref:Uncharacterized protein n=1 Tax=Paracoccus amoyensis TaxID=2760093 RepID=A0A926GE96_9RHOB|nr:hypothetical protein [Paracoccus amoyensis]MBC9246722.1 hypothetical protein [Paracoccus amoyensis]
MTIIDERTAALWMPLLASTINKAMGTSFSIALMEQQAINQKKTVKKPICGNKTAGDM